MFPLSQRVKAHPCDTQHLAGQPGFHRKSRSQNSLILPHNSLIPYSSSQPPFPGPASGVTISFRSADKNGSSSFRQHELNYPCLHYTPSAITREISPLSTANPAFCAHLCGGGEFLSPFSPAYLKVSKKKYKILEAYEENT